MVSTTKETRLCKYIIQDWKGLQLNTYKNTY